MSTVAPEQTEKMSTTSPVLSHVHPTQGSVHHFHSGTSVTCAQMENQNTISSHVQLIASLYKEIDIRNSKIQEAEDKYNKTCSSITKLLSSLVEKIESQDTRICELEHDCKEKDAARLSTSSLLVGLSNEVDSKNEEIAKLKQRCYKMSEKIESQDKRIAELEHDCKEKDAARLSTSRKLVGLSNEVDRKDEEIAKLKQRCYKMFDDRNRLMEERHMLNRSYLQEARKIQETDLQNKRLKYEMKSVEKELEQLVQRTDEAQTGQGQSFPKKLAGSLQNHILTLKKELEHKTDEVYYLQNLNEMLIYREHMSNNELVVARQELLSSLQTVLSNRTMLGIRRMGALDSKPFQDACASKFVKEECGIKCAEACSEWEECLKDSNWHPFKHNIIDGNLQEIVDDSDARLEALRTEWGDEAYKAVTSALLELNEYNPSGRYPVPEIWNFREERKASLKEIIGYIIQQLKTRKRKRW